MSVVFEDAVRSKAQIAEEDLLQTRSIYQNLGIKRGRRALIVGSDRESNIGASIASELRNFGGDSYPSFETDEPTIGELDVAYPDDVRRCDMTPYDVLVLANGFTHLDWIEDLDQVHIWRTLTSNLYGSQLMTAEFVRQTIEMPYRKFIVYVGSMAYKSVLNASAYYCSAKAGLAAFAKCAAWELTPKGYRVFCVHPSNTEGTPMTEKTIEGIQRYRGITREEAEAYWGAINLMPGWLQAGDIAETVRYLVTEPSAEFLSGADIELKAGQR